MSEDTKYDEKELKKLWEMSYKDLVIAAKTGITVPRFVMQAKVAMETRRLIWMTFAMAAATFAMAIATFLR